MIKLSLHIFIFGLCTLVSVSHATNAGTPVFVATVAEKAFFDKIEALGTLTANESVSLSASVTELVTGVHFSDGQRVKAGDLLIEMDASEELAGKAEEQSRLTEARRQINRLEPLVKQGASPQSALDEQRVVLQTSLARMQAIEAQVHQRIVRAPFDGVVGQKNLSVGALLQPGMLITTIDDDSIMKLDFAVPEIFLADLQQGIRVEARSSAWPNDVFIGSLSSVSSRVDPITRSVSVRALLDNPDRKLRPGMLMRVQLERHPREAMIIPEEALVIRGKQHSVFRVKKSEEGSIVESVKVELGTRRRGEVEILSGLAIGDQVVTHGTLKVRSGSAVSVKAVDDTDTNLAGLLAEQVSGASAK